MNEKNYILYFGSHVGDHQKTSLRLEILMEFSLENLKVDNATICRFDLKFPITPTFSINLMINLGQLLSS